ncbi:hypothetical protein ABT282_07465 [Streptomyces sp. NPDC000927]|uniref:hypothetical protein n=1 Tax=Streptomyces sp. NPDC000927 TaxID=3154371 RepID=UPI0033223AE2
MVLITHKVKGQEIAVFDLNGDVATVVSSTCDAVGRAFSTGRRLLTGDVHYAATIRKNQDSGRWSVTIGVRHTYEGGPRTLEWSAGEFPGTRGTAVYRAFLAFGEALEKREIPTQRREENREGDAAGGAPVTTRPGRVRRVLPVTMLCTHVVSLYVRPVRVATGGGDRSRRRKGRKRALTGRA